jgi:radical SAM superfamily enzyme YgiQ (UPF0313 family)
MTRLFFLCQQTTDPPQADLFFCIMTKDNPKILLINPWIHDFAAYDFWAKPMGLLTIAAILRHHGVSVSYIDCLNRFHPRAPKRNPNARYGRGPYIKTHIPKPAGFNDVPRFFSRYGIKPQWLKEDLLKLRPPDLVLVTSLMTYWYPGVLETIRIIKSIFPQTPVVLGGIYARLCLDHAQNNSGADRVIAAPAEKILLALVQELTGFSATPAFDPSDLDSYPYPALNLQTRINYIPLVTSRGCPFNCTYCASHLLDPQRMLRSPESIVEEIRYWHKNYGVVDFVLYDDAFLVDPNRHAIPVLEGILNANIRVRFHTPNAVHIRGITSQTARYMRKAGFKTLRLGLETAQFEHRQEIDQKVSQGEFIKALNCLQKAGFDKSQVGAYLLVGLPGQKMSSVEQSARTVKRLGLTPIPAYYTPIPHTALWPKAVAASRYDLEADPLFTNNSVLPCRKEPFHWDWITAIKKIVTA